EALHPGFLAGAELAEAEINAKGGILGRPIKIKAVDEAGFSERAEERNLAARRHFDHDRVLAVMGGSSDLIIRNASDWFDDLGILYFNPLFPLSNVGNPGKPYVFATIPDRERIGDNLAQAMSEMGATRIAIVASRERAAQEIRHSIQDIAPSLALDVVADLGMAGADASYIDELVRLSSAQPEAIALLLPKAEREVFLRQAARMKLNAPIFLGHPEGIVPWAEDFAGLTATEWPELELWQAEPLENPRADRAGLSRFQTSYQSRFDQAPSYWAAQGYDTLRMIAQVAEEIGSDHPLQIATALNTQTAWTGITGPHSFTNSGRIYTKDWPYGPLRLTDLARNTLSH
ncbi:MAG: ABC transporter substrate-binding protein, partial [Mangrovicoccus sp.]